MKKTFLKTTLLLAWLVLASSASAAGTSTETTINLQLFWGSVTIWAPQTIEFGTGTVSSSITHKLLDMSTWNTAWVGWVSWVDYSYFWVEDLLSSSSGYSTDLKISDLADGSRTIASGQVSLTLTWWNSPVTLLDGLTSTSAVPPEVVLIDAPAWTTMDNAISAITRTWATTPHSWIIWKYWFRPSFDITIPKYQALWNYQATITYTLTEN